MEKIIELEGRRWKLILDDNYQLAFTIEIPELLSSWKTDPMWHSWNPTDTSNQPEWSSTFSTSELGITPQKIKHFLLGAITEFINELHLNFFYFKPTSDVRANIYTNLAGKLADKLDGAWTYQIIDNHWYYFTQHEQN